MNKFIFYITLCCSSIIFTSAPGWSVPNIYMGYQLEGRVLDYDIVSYVNPVTNMSVEISIVTKGDSLYLHRNFKNDQDQTIQEDDQKLQKEDDWYQNWIAYKESKEYDFCDENK